MTYEEEACAADDEVEERERNKKDSFYDAEEEAYGSEDGGQGIAARGRDGRKEGLGSG